MKEDQSKELEDEAESATADAAALPEISVPGIPVNYVTGKPRKTRKEMKHNVPPPEDDGSYIRNASGKFARLYVEGDIAYKVPLYHVYHLVDRQLNGNDDGTPRDGISDDIIMPIVLQCIDHFMLYSAVLPFVWLNYKRNGDVVVVICQKEIDGELITIPIEAYLIEGNMIEITVRTAYPLDFDRGIGHDQYALELWQDGSSTLKRYDKRKKIFNDLCSVPLDKLI